MGFAAWRGDAMRTPVESRQHEIEPEDDNFFSAIARPHRMRRLASTIRADAHSGDANPLSQSDVFHLLRVRLDS
jgi:hypothetical protein